MRKLAELARNTAEAANSFCWFLSYPHGLKAGHVAMQFGVTGKSGLLVKWKQTVLANRWNSVKKKKTQKTRLDKAKENEKQKWIQRSSIYHWPKADTAWGYWTTAPAPSKHFRVRSADWNMMIRNFKRSPILLLLLLKWNCAKRNAKVEFSSYLFGAYNIFRCFHLNDLLLMSW